MRQLSYLGGPILYGIVILRIDGFPDFPYSAASVFVAYRRKRFRISHGKKTFFYRLNHAKSHIFRCTI